MINAVFIFHLLFIPFAQSAKVCCLGNPQEVRLYQLVVNHESQQRVGIICNPILSEQARLKALDMGLRGYVAHINPDGTGPNRMVANAGYRLPGHYSMDPEANSIESLAAGYITPKSAFEGWLRSEGHRRHILGEVEFFANQHEIGIGYAYVKGSPHEHYYAFLSAYGDKRNCLNKIWELN